MPANKNASYRYRLIDYILRNEPEGIAFQKLKEIVSQRLYEEYDVETGVSERTLRDDFRIMRKDPPEGYGAPIVSKDKKVFYQDPDYSMMNMPLNKEDLDVLIEVSLLLRQFKGLPFYDEIRPMITKMQSYIDYHKNEIPADNLLQFDINRLTKGLEWIELIYRSMRKDQKIRLSYAPFKEPTFTGTFQPYFIKEFQNRWFLIAISDRNEKVYVFALDRIKHCERNEEVFVRNKSLNPEEWTSEVIGITHPEDAEVRSIILHCSNEIAPYVMTKPFHESQQTEKEYTNGSIDISLRIKPNHEFFGRIHTFLPHIFIRQPKDVVEKQKALVRNMWKALK